MNVVKEINKINELELQGNGQGSWHDDYKDSARIFVGGLDFKLTEGDVIAIFSQYGEIADIHMPRDKETGRPRGFAFLMYIDQRSTVLAVDNLNGAKVLQRTIRVDHTKGYKQPGTKNDDGEYEEPDEERMNALPPMVGGSEGAGAAPVEEIEAGEEEDPMAAYIRESKRARLAEGGTDGKKDKKDKHRSKEEKAFRKEEKKRAKNDKHRSSKGESSSGSRRPDLRERDREHRSMHSEEPRRRRSPSPSTSSYRRREGSPPSRQRSPPLASKSRCEDDQTTFIRRRDSPPRSARYDDHPRSRRGDSPPRRPTYDTGRPRSPYRDGARDRPREDRERDGPRGRDERGGPSYGGESRDRYRD